MSQYELKVIQSEEFLMNFGFVFVIKYPVIIVFINGCVPRHLIMK